MQTRGRDWIDDLPPELAGQQALLRGLLAPCAAGDRKPVTSEEIREWAFGGWCALADLGKYLRRGSTWEALARLNEARSQLWQLWAVTLGVPDPQYGLTSVLDFAPGELPAGFEG